MPGPELPQGVSLESLEKIEREDARVGLAGPVWGLGAATAVPLSCVFGILSGWMSDALGRLNVLRLMIGISAVAMPLLYLTGSSVAMPCTIVFVVYWCYGTQLSVNGSATSDFWGTKNAGINYGLLFTAWGVAGIIGPRIGGQLFDRYKNYEAAFYNGRGTCSRCAGV